MCVQAEGLGLVQHLGEVGGEGVRVRVVGVVADVAADAAQPVVAQQPLQLLEGDGARRPLGVSGELHLVVAVAGQLLEDAGEADGLHLVAEGVELDAEVAAAARSGRPCRRCVAAAAGVVPSRVAAVAPAATPRNPRRRSLSASSGCWALVTCVSPVGCGLGCGRRVSSQVFSRPARRRSSDLTSVAATRPGTASGWEQMSTGPSSSARGQPAVAAAHRGRIERDDGHPVAHPELLAGERGGRLDASRTGRRGRGRVRPGRSRACGGSRPAGRSRARGRRRSQ